MTRGFTLLELMATVTLIALVATTASVSWAPMIEATDRRSVEGRVRDALSRARLAALRQGRAIVSFSRDGYLIKVRDDRGEILRETEWPSSLRVRLAKPEREDALVFDSFGRTTDFVVEISSHDGTKVLEGSGISGWIETKDLSQ